MSHSQASITSKLMTDSSHLDMDLPERERLYFRAYVQHVMDIIACFSPTGTCQYVSPSCQTQLGYTPEELQHQLAIDLVHPDDHAALHQVLADFDTGDETPMLSCLRLQGKDGVYRWLEVTFLRLPASYSGEVCDILVIAHNITAQKQAEERLHLSEEIAAQHELFQMVVENTPAGIAILAGAEHRYLNINPAYQPLVTGKGDIVGRTVAEVFPEIADEIIPLLDHVYQTGEPYAAEDMPFTFLRNGQWDDTFITFSYTPWHDTQGVIRGVMVLAMETTKRKHIEEALRRSEVELQTIFENLVEGLIVATIDGSKLQWNRAALDMHGLLCHEEVYGNLSSLATIFELASMDGTVLQVEQWPLACILRGDHIAQWELRIRRHNTEWQRIFSYGGSLIRDMDGQPLMAVVTVQDVTERKVAEQRLYYQATHDELTGLPNRALFTEYLTNAVKYAQRKSQPLAIMLMDLDTFKPINDTLGHDIGDMVLQSVAQRLTASLRESDMIARLGGDEFTILFAGADLSEICDVAQRLLENVATPIVLNGHACHVTASLGISRYPDDGQGAETLIKAADSAMYQAKVHRNCFVFFGKEQIPHTCNQVL